MITNQRIVPALIPRSATELTETIAKLPFVHELQIDVVDGNFVPDVSWPYDPVGTPSDIAAAVALHSVEVDVMASDPVSATAAWVAAGAQQVVLHIETLSVPALATLRAAHPNVTLGASISSGTAIETLEPYLAQVDYVQLMGIAAIGSQGQPFDTSVLERIQTMRAQHPELLISIDGSVNPDTLPQLVAAGADRFVVGSALLRSDDWEGTYEALEAMARPQ